MARIRYVKPEFFEDQRIGKLSHSARLLFIGLWTLMDRNGLTEATTTLIRSRLFAYDDVRIKDVDGWLEELIQSERLKRVVISGQELLYCPNLRKHQHFNQHEKPKYVLSQEEVQALDQCDASTVQNISKDRINPDDNGVGSREEGGGSARSIEHASNAPPLVIDEFKSIGGLLAGRGVGPKIQRTWLETYPDPEWIMAKIKRASAWELETGRRKVRFAAFIGRWLAKDWDSRRAVQTGINTRPLDLTTLEPIP